MEINNFYTATVYRKGAEIVRTTHTLVGEEKFRKGMDLYFQRFDGQAVTQEDFVKAIGDAAHVDLSQFMLWYTQAGTPEVKVACEYNSSQKSVTLRISQKTAPTLLQENKFPLHIPIVFGFLDAKTGKPLGLRMPDEKTAVKERTIELRDTEETFTFVDISGPVVPTPFSAIFSAPVRSYFPYSKQDLITIMNYDSDPHNSWDAAHQLYIHTLLNQVSHKGAPVDPESWVPSVNI